MQGPWRMGETTSYERWGWTHRPITPLFLCYPAYIKCIKEFMFLDRYCGRQLFLHQSSYLLFSLFTLHLHCDPFSLSSLLFILDCAFLRMPGHLVCCLPLLGGWGVSIPELQRNVPQKQFRQSLSYANHRLF